MKKQFAFLVFIAVTFGFFIIEKPALKLNLGPSIELLKLNRKSGSGLASENEDAKGQSTGAKTANPGMPQLNFAFKTLPSLEEIERSLEGKTTWELDRLLRKSKKLIVAKELIRKANTGKLTQMELELLALEMRRQSIIQYLLLMDTRS